MGVSKVIYGGKVLIDLTSDTVKASDLLTGVTAHGSDGEPIVGTCSFDANTQDANATASEVLKDRIVYVRGVKVTGSMPNNGAVKGVITSKDTPYIVPPGFHDGSGTVRMDDTEAAKLVPDNIRQGVTVFGVTGTMSGLESVKAQAKTITPAISDQSVVPDEGYNYISQVTVLAIPYEESSNAAGGITATIG